MLPPDWRAGRFVGRIESEAGPTPVLIQDGMAYDMAEISPTVSALLERHDLSRAGGAALGPLEGLEFSAKGRDSGMALLSPVDLQCIKAAGVTFAVSAIERVIEERAHGDAGAALAVRARLEGRIGAGIRSVSPGTAEAARLKAALIEEALWSQYLEVAIGPDAEIFTKAPVLSSVGWGADIGVRSDSSWNNPEPEIVLIVNSRGQAVGATLGNDVNLRDVEGRSALLLGKAKDNNASCALGPFIRLFGPDFNMHDVRQATVDLLIEGAEGYLLSASSSMREISRDPQPSWHRRRVSTSTRTVSRCSSARCSRRFRTATKRGGASPTRKETACASPHPAWGLSSTVSLTRRRLRRGPSASAR